MHPALEPLTGLLGTWRGRGRGEYPSIESFEYDEETRFWHVGRPFLAYLQQTWLAPSRAPAHSEMGYWRPKGDGVIEVVLSHSFGLVEVQEGRIEGTRIELASTSLSGTSTATRVDAVTRSLTVDGGTLTYDMGMAFEEHDMQPHLRARLERHVES